MHLIQHYSYFGLFVILTIEEAGIFLPVPGDLAIAAVAALPRSNYFLVVASVVLSTLLGSAILFTVSRKLGHYLIVRFGKYIKITPEKVKKIEKWFAKYGGAAIVVGRLTPGLRTITSIVAGTFEVSYKTFLIYTFIAAFIWANVYYFIGKFFGEIVEKFLR